jgi:hypothetical protein
MSNKKRKRLISPTLSNVPLVEPKVVGDPTGNESLAEFRRRYNREQKQQSEAAIQQSVAELTDTMIQLRAAKREALFKVPSEELAAVTSQVPEYVEGSVDEVRSQIKSALHTVIMELSRSGVTLRDSGRDKMVVVSRLNLTVDWRVAANWRKLYEHMSGLNVFTDEDVTAPKPVVVEEAPKPTIGDLEKINIGAGTESERRARYLVTDLMAAEIQPIANRWYEHLYSDYGFVPTAAQHKYVMDWFAQGANPMILSSWDAARRSAVSVGVFPNHMLTSREQASLDLENLNLATMSFDEKRQLKNRLQRLQS